MKCKALIKHGLQIIRSCTCISRKFCFQKLQTIGTLQAKDCHIHYNTPIEMNFVRLTLHCNFTSALRILEIRLQEIEIIGVD